jgi:hypothetical protein
MKLRSFVALPLVMALGCAVESNTTTNDENEIVNVPQTDVERQSIGNCWIYAHASWIESMHLTASGETFDLSQSYWTYWHWFDQIAGGFATKISTGGNWSTANGIIRKYGLMAEKDFVALDTDSEMSARQAQALDRLNTSLASGALSTPTARRDKTILRREMDAAWGLSPDVTAMLDRVFGEAVTKTFASPTTPADAAGSAIVRAADFAVSYPSAPARAADRKTLAQAMTEWRQVYYANADRRAFLIRVQKALHDAQPVVITWFVDFNAMENRDTPLKGSFNIRTLTEFGPGRQGGHMTVLEDYQAKLPDGTVLVAGETLAPNDPRLAEALDPRTEVELLRVKNSWGAARPDRAFAPGMPGYHDLYLDYLNGPVKRCVERDGDTDTMNCPFDHTPLQNVVLPPGY